VWAFPPPCVSRRRMKPCLNEVVGPPGLDPAIASRMSRPVALRPRMRRSATAETSLVTVLVTDLVTGHTCKRPSPNGKGPLTCYFVVAGAGFEPATSGL
jgi:hypothetical protein